MALSLEYRKFYTCKDMTRRELKKLELIDRIRYLIKREPRDRWTAKEVRKRLLEEGLICEMITVQNVEDEMKAFYG